uniref:Hypothetical secreted peptide n=1 Tax=Glossina morsitans morsitans TaxID=37546 RepID=D3TSK4_GLOMM
MWVVVVLVDFYDVLAEAGVHYAYVVLASLLTVSVTVVSVEVDLLLLLSRNLMFSHTSYYSPAPLNVISLI